MSRTFASVAAAARRVDPSADAVSVAEVVWLAALGRAEAELTPGPLQADAADGGPEPPGAGPAPERTSARPRPTPNRVGQPLFDMTSGGAGARAARQVGIGRARALPRALQLARALRPFKSPWPTGRRRELDIPATVQGYAETGEFIAAFRPGPERWFEAVLVIDDAPGMVVWDDVAQEFRRLLGHLGAFRTVRSFQLAMSAAQRPVLRDAVGRQVAPRQLRAADGRRLILVFSDCAADRWRGPELWQTLHSWSESTATALVNPLSAKLWHHVGLDLPAVRVRSTAAGSRNTALIFRPPPLLIAPEPKERWLPVPVMGLTPHSLRRFSAMLMRGDPAGCDAVVTAVGGRPGESLDDDDEQEGPFGVSADLADGETDESAAADALVTSFRRLASPTASRLAVLCSTYSQLTLPVLRLIAERAVPGSDTGDVGEVIAGGLFHIGTRGDIPVLSFRPGVQRRLQEHLHVNDVMSMYEVLSRHVGERVGSRQRFPVALADPAGDVDLPDGAVPLATASAEVLRLLGLSASQPGAGPDERPPPVTNPAEPAEERSAWDSIRADLLPLLSRRTDDARQEARRLESIAELLERAALAAAGFTSAFADAVRAVDAQRAAGTFVRPAFVSALITDLVDRYLLALLSWAHARPGTPEAWAVLFRRMTSGPIPAHSPAAAGLNAMLNYDLPQATLTAAEVLELPPADGTPQHLDHRRLVAIIAASAPHFNQGYFERWQLLVATLNGEVDEGYGGELADYSRDVVWRSTQQLWRLRKDPVGLARERELLDSTTGALGRLLTSSLGASLHFETDVANIERDPVPPVSTGSDPPASSAPGRQEGPWGSMQSDMSSLLSTADPDDVPAVVERLSDLLAVLEHVPPLLAANPLADFTALYLSITTAVLERLYEGAFADPAFLARVDVELAGRYFDALRLWDASSQDCPQVWQALFRRLSGPDVRQLTSAAAGVNAHLNFDLPFALVATFDHLGSEPVDGSDQHRDYQQLNDIFATSIPTLRRGYLEKWQLLIDTMSGDLDDWYQGELVDYTRDVAWRNAQRLWVVHHDVEAVARERSRLDGSAASLGRLLLSPLGAVLQ